jgi:hypothetical protein
MTSDPRCVTLIAVSPVSRNENAIFREQQQAGSSSSMRSASFATPSITGSNWPVTSRG